MAKGFFIGIVFSIIVVLAGGYASLKLGLVPANADAKPGPVEKWAANTSLEATLSRQAPKKPNPVQLTDENLVSGIHLYARHCAECHGTSAGESSATPVARGQYVPPPQLASEGVEDDPPGRTFWVIDHGIRWTAMPSWKDALTKHQIWTLALFLKHMNNLPPAAEKAWNQVTN